MPSSLATGNNWVVMKMTRDEVMKMTDEELQIQAAELLGWTNISNVRLMVGGKDITMRPNWQGRTPDGVYELIPLPDFPTNMTAAIGLSDSIQDRYWMELKSPFEPGCQWFAGFTPIGTTGWNGIPDNQMPGTVPARAITRAFILAMKENHE